MKFSRSKKDAEKPKSLKDPGPCIALVMTTEFMGPSKIEFTGSTAWAVAVLRDMADDLEAKAANADTIQP